MPRFWLSPDAVAIGALLALAIAAVQTLRLAAGRGFRRRRLAAQQRRAFAGEARAESLLRAQGYTILGRQVSASYPIRVDGSEISVGLRADYVVQLRGKRYAAEVKTGERAPRIDTAATRRQLLEYRIALNIDGVLLVDADGEEVHAVEFPLDQRAIGRGAASAKWLMVGLLLGAAAAWVAASWTGPS